MNIKAREKKLFLVTALCLGIWMIYSFLVQPACERLQTLERVIPEKTAALQTLQRQVSRYTALNDEYKSLLAEIHNQPPDFALLPYLEKLTKELHLDENLVALRPQTRNLDEKYTEYTVSVQLEQIPFDKLVQFISRINKARTPLQIKKIDIRMNATDNTKIDPTIDIVHFGLI